MDSSQKHASMTESYHCFFMQQKLMGNLNSG